MQPPIPPDLLRRFAVFFRTQRRFNDQCDELLETFDEAADDVRQEIADLILNPIHYTLTRVEVIWNLIDRWDLDEEPRPHCNRARGLLSPIPRQKKEPLDDK
jgi:hypothetical protein